MTRAVITFHSVDDSGSVLSYPAPLFASLVEDLLRSGVPIVAFDDLLKLDRGVTLTFDDGMQSVHRNALPVLRSNRVRAHLFLSTGAIGQATGWSIGNHRLDMMNWREVEDCQDAGISVECHTVSHPDLRKLGNEQIRQECDSADLEIERHLGRRPTKMAFPFGYYDQRVLGAVTPAYKHCFTTKLRYLESSDSEAEIPRIDSYYLIPPACRRNPLGFHTRAYLGLRSLARTLLGRQ